MKKKLVLIFVLVVIVLSLSVVLLFKTGVIGKTIYQKIAGTYKEDAGRILITFNEDQTGAMTVQVLLTSATSPFTYEIDEDKIYINVQGSSSQGNTMKGFSSMTYKMTEDGITLTVDATGAIFVLRKVG